MSFRAGGLGFFLERLLAPMRTALPVEVLPRPRSAMLASLEAYFLVDLQGLHRREVSTEFCFVASSVHENRAAHRHGISALFGLAGKPLPGNAVVGLL